MYKIFTPLLLIFMLASVATPASAQLNEKNERRVNNEAREDRGIVPALLRLIERAQQNPRAQQQEQEDATSPPEPEENAGASAEEMPSAAPAAEEDSSSAPLIAPAPRASASPQAPTWGATTTPILNTHHGGASSVYADEWPLDRTQSSVLFVLSMGLVAGGLLLAERDSLRRLFPSAGGILLAPPRLPEKRTALS